MIVFTIEYLVRNNLKTLKNRCSKFDKILPELEAVNVGGHGTYSPYALRERCP